MTATAPNYQDANFGNRPTGAARTVWTLGGVAIVLVIGIAAWLSRSDSYPMELGATVDPAHAEGVAATLAAYGGGGNAQVVIRGQVGEVCRSAGCWFVLQEIRDGQLHQLFIDLKKRADFTINGDAAGRWATVSGRLVGSEPDVSFEADGLRLE